MNDEKKNQGFTPHAPWTPCIGDKCTHSSHSTPPSEVSTEETLREIVYRNWKLDDEVSLFTESRDLLKFVREEAKRELAEEVVKMADDLEHECGLDGDKGTKQWMNFKGFRNTIRDKYIIPNNEKK